MTFVHRICDYFKSNKTVRDGVIFRKYEAIKTELLNEIDEIPCYGCCKKKQSVFFQFVFRNRLHSRNFRQLLLNLGKIIIRSKIICNFVSIPLVISQNRAVITSSAMR